MGGRICCARGCARTAIAPSVSDARRRGCSRGSERRAIRAVTAGFARSCAAGRPTRFQALCGHYLFEPDFCNRAAGWEKGIVEKNVQDRRRQVWREAAERRWPDLDTLNDWLGKRCKAAWGEMRHPQWPELTLAEVLQDEQARLMPLPRAFDGYVELPARVSATGLVHLHRNRYSVPTEFAHRVVSLRVYPCELVVTADAREVARHVRSFERDHTFYDWQHYISLVLRKPGALRPPNALSARCARSPTR